MERRWRPALECPALLAAALLCAWISNRTAGPTRHLNWRPNQIALAAAPVESALARPSAEFTPAAASASIASVKREVTRTQPHPSTTAAAKDVDWDPAALLARFPLLQGRPYADISGDEARWLQLHGALILDARRSDVYAAGHLPGAKSLSVWEDGLEGKIARLGAEKADPILPMVVYCAGGECEDSHLLAQKLWLAGYRNLRIYDGGFPEWEARGWPTHRGEHP